MPGPAPKPADQRVRRNAPMANTVKLPAEGRKGAAPKWPLHCEKPEIWDELWALPQAVMWERQGWTRTLARYAKLVVDTERSDEVTGKELSEIRQLEIEFGITPKAMRHLQWEVVSDEVDEVRQEKSKPAKRRVLKAVPDAMEA